jgi:hypothetical protein
MAMCRTNAGPAELPDEFAPRSQSMPRSRQGSGAALTVGRCVPVNERAIQHIDPTALPKIGSRIDWDISPNHLLAGDLSALDPQDAWLIERAAALPEAIALAKQMNIDPIVLIVALIARSQSRRNRSAARIAKAIFGNGFTDELRSIAGKLGLG